ncbi:hypothetical protein [Xenorhabdus szentirmaii]|uniref:Uncharacterized protein n=1 Tax=Xenorhabdus szentirmaii TaxID=290112 RepID=A0AAW3Z1R2_9GAMM|nr:MULTISPECIES: hypothetical protein [unclassified Xenorhabdus]MBD2791747.1 hypothetical protein [Xenorhabdus sp. CUL]MBD2802937.1 hypothetical protein [Xenorhabdus sp. M]MBD2826933.1 hypothetical protein [Xenorhabdus sp. 5]
MTRGIPKKAAMLIDIDADTCGRYLDDDDRINILCMALVASAEGTKHYHEALDLIKSLAPRYYREVFVKKGKT